MVKKMSYIMFYTLILLIVAILSLDIYVKESNKDRIYTNIDNLPKTNVALLLGTSKYIKKGKINYFYKYRIDATEKLYKNGKIKAVLISGDNASKYYNEPATMRQDLIKRGIPKDKIYLDFAGFRTLDSILRAKNIFNLDRFVIISQKFHLERALFISKKYKIDAIGFVAKDIKNTKAALRMQFREYLARVKAFLDLYILDTKPKFFGKFEKIEIKEN